jgi:hypothetical protein
LTTEVGTRGELDRGGDAPRAPGVRGAWAAAGGLVAAAILVFAPILYYMVLHWSEQPDYSHGFLVAPLAVYFA